MSTRSRCGHKTHMCSPASQTLHSLMCAVAQGRSQSFHPCLLPTAPCLCPSTFPHPSLPRRSSPFPSLFLHPQGFPPSTAEAPPPSDHSHRMHYDNRRESEELAPLLEQVEKEAAPEPPLTRWEACLYFYEDVR
jgi:hypothetical protein